MSYAHAVMMLTTPEGIEPEIWLRALANADWRYHHPDKTQDFATGIIITADGIVRDTTIKEKS